MRVFFAGIMMLGLTGLLVEIGLRVIDPLGVYMRQVDWHIFYNHLQPHETGYRLPDGTLRMTGYDATINPDASRYTPDTVIDTDCTIAAVGDSMTFGMGVNDSETWVNQLAMQFDDVTFINTGRPRYNIADAQALINHYPADGYIYLHTLNDNQPNNWQMWLSRGYVEPYKPALYYYYHDLYSRIRGSRLPDTDEPMHRNALDTIAGMDNVLILAMDNDWLLDRLPDDTVIISWHDAPISAADAHPNPAGHINMALDMLPAIETFIESVCEA
ncbi:MAG: hypothetical protein ACPG7F_09635 [Aggregatilineales bacterium]